MEHDLQLRAAARASEDWAPVGFDDAERFGSIHYRQTVGAAQKVRRPPPIEIRQATPTGGLPSRIRRSRALIGYGGSIRIMTGLCLLHDRAQSAGGAQAPQGYAAHPAGRRSGTLADRPGGGRAQLTDRLAVTADERGLIHRRQMGRQ